VKVVLDFCVVPIGVGTSVSEHVVACQRVLEEAGLTHRMHAYGTNVEGEWDDVMAAVKRCHQVLHQRGVPRISTTLRVGTRQDKDQDIDSKIRSVEDKLAAGPG